VCGSAQEFPRAVFWTDSVQAGFVQGLFLFLLGTGLRQLKNPNIR